ncbi:MAG: hypothetical protein EZS28_002957 [Streblomastix strix]|uniref:Uncharacterized protein n=1 Tax=Streblomastix strix TaxID=222440 RepID=A0A5J4X2U1_9EUKA|nr:MAG: hypothetical protein EZS28_002957 [Streblomastix strix]
MVQTIPFIRLKRNFGANTLNIHKCPVRKQMKLIFDIKSTPQKSIRERIVRKGMQIKKEPNTHMAAENTPEAERKNFF